MTLKTPTKSLNRSNLANGSVKIANLLIAATIGLVVARAGWQLWLTTSHAAPWAAPSVISDVTADTQPDYSIEAIVGTHLFGRSTSGSDQARASQVTAPETHLALNLTGIFAGRGQSTSWALIKDAKGQQAPYTVGDPIMDGVQMYAIYNDHVILDRNGHYEALSLEDKEQDKDGQTAPTSRTQAGDVRKAIVNNPASFRLYVRMRPARRNGELVGYSVYPGERAEMFNDIGLQSGDVVTAVDGQSLKDKQKVLGILSQLKTADQTTLTILRNGNKRTVNVRFN